MNGNYFSQNLVALRRKQGLTTGKLAQALKVTEESIVGWEMGLSEPTIKDIIKVAKYFNVDTAELANEQMFAQTSAVKAKAVNATNKAGALSLVMISLVMLLSVFTLISFALPCFEVDALGLIITVTFFDILTPVEFTIEALFGWIMLFVLIFNIVNGIIWISSKRIRNTKYNKISQILSYSLNGLSLLFWIIVAIRWQITDFKFTSIWLFIAFALILGCLAFITYEYLNAGKEKVAKIKQPMSVSTKNIIKLTMFYVFASAALVGLVVVVIAIILAHLDLGRLDEICMLYLGMILASFIISILLMVNKINRNARTKKSLAIVGIVLSALSPLIVLFLSGYHMFTSTFLIWVVASVALIIANIIMLCVKREKETY